MISQLGGWFFNENRNKVTYVAYSNDSIRLINSVFQRQQSHYDLHIAKPLKFHSFVRFYK